MYNYYYDNFSYPNEPFWFNRFPEDFDIPYIMPYPYIDTINPIAKPPMQHTPVNIYKNINTNILNLNNEARKLWEENAIWTKLTIAGILNNEPDLQTISQRLSLNAENLGKFIKTYYGFTTGNKFRDLLRSQSFIIVDLIEANKKNDSSSIISLEAKLYKNADEIADFLSSINPYWDKEEMKKMLYDHIALVKNQISTIISKQYDEDIAVFDRMIDQALTIADSFTQGILKQFPNKF